MEQKGKNKKKSKTDELIETYSQLEGKFSNLSTRKIVLLVVAVALGFAALGVLLGLAFSPYQSDSGVASTQDNVRTVSYSGVVRQTTGADGQSRFYLDRADESRVFLRGSKFDFTFFLDSSVTAEGVVITGSEGEDEILFVNKIRIK